MIAALAKANLLELMRSRVYLVALGLTVLLAMLAALVDQLATGEEGRVVVDLGLWAGGLLVDMLAIALALTSAVSLQSTASLLLFSRPVTRAQVVFGRFAAVVVVVLSASALAGVVVFVTGTLTGSPSGVMVLPAAGLIAAEGVVVAAIAFAAGATMSTPAATMAAALLLIVGRLGDLLLELARAGRFGSATTLVEIVARVVPQFWRFETGRWLHNPSWSEYATHLGYAALLSCGVMALGAALFQRREL